MRNFITIPKNSTERVKRYNFRYRQNRKNIAMLWGWTHHLTKVKLFKSKLNIMDPMTCTQKYNKFTGFPPFSHCIYNT